MIPLLIEAGVALAFMGAEWAYHRWWESKPLQKIAPQAISIPRADEGSPVPLIYGRCRVRAPIIVWCGEPDRVLMSGIYGYRMNMFFVVGIAMAEGQGESRMYNMWAGDKKFGGGPWNVSASESQSIAIITEIAPSGTDSTDAVTIGSNLVYYDGNPIQDLSTSQLSGLQMAAGVSASQIPSYLGYVTALLFTSSQKWVIGTSPQVAAYSFEVSSAYQLGDYPAPGVYSQIGYDCNPANVIWDLLVGSLGKLAVPSAYLDKPSFQAAAFKLYAEDHGYSRSFEQSQPAEQIIQDILKQIDGAIDEDPTTGKLVLTLVRPVDPATLPHITRDNCDKLTGFTMGGWTGLPSSLRFIYESRAKDYNDNTIVIHNQGNAVQQQEFEEAAIEMRGCKEDGLATRLADRESQALFRPIIKCRAVVGREFLRVLRGQAVKVTWSGPDLSGVVFRVADVNRGTIEDGKIILDLISDFYYSARGQVQIPVIEQLSDYKSQITDAVTLNP